MSLIIHSHRVDGYTVTVGDDFVCRVSRGGQSHAIGTMNDFWLAFPTATAELCDYVEFALRSADFSGLAVGPGLSAPEDAWYQSMWEEALRR